MGTESIKALVGFGFDVANKIKDITAEDSAGGKKITITEVIGSIGLITKIPALIRYAPEAYREWLELDDSETVELKAFFADRFDLNNDKVEDAVEAAWNIVLSIGELIRVLES
jgi:hypothetical protein